MSMDFESAAVCGECHLRQYEEWRQSMHAYAAISPVFDAMAAKSFRDTAGVTGTFCTGCHSPMGTALGEPGSTTAADRSELSREGISCDVCHSAVDHTTPVGNTGLVLDPGAPKQGPYVTDANEGHLGEESSFSTSSELCGSCHDVFNFPALNIEEAYTEYVEGPAPEEGLRCQDCHMGTVPGLPGEREWGQSAEGAVEIYPDRELATHRFIGPDYSLLDDFPYPDDLQRSAAAQEEYAGQIQILLENAVRIADVGVEWAAWGARLDIDVENLTPGHRVPTGFTSERQLWLHVTVTGESGEVLLESGDLDSYGDLRDAHSWDVVAGELPLDSTLANFQSKNMLRYGSQDDGEGGLDLQTTETIFPFDADYILKRSLEPGETRRLSYSIFATEPLNIQVELRYRNLPPYVLRALHLEDLVERLRIFTIDTQLLEVEAP